MTPKELVQNHIIRRVFLEQYEITELFQPLQDFENACLGAAGQEFHVDRDTTTGKYFWWEAFSVEVLLEEPDRVEDFNNESAAIFPSELQAWCDCATQNQITPYYVEVMEVWLVSDWMFDRLESLHQPVIKWKGLPLWGRTGKGSALYQESLIEEIAATVH
jgi:hypothetical protein